MSLASFKFNLPWLDKILILAMCVASSVISRRSWIRRQVFQGKMHTVKLQCNSLLLSLSLVLTLPVNAVTRLYKAFLIHTITQPFAECNYKNISIQMFKAGVYYIRAFQN